MLQHLNMEPRWVRIINKTVAENCTFKCVCFFQQSLLECESQLSSHGEDSAFSPNVESLANARGSFLTLTPVYSFFFLSNLEIFPALTVSFFPTLTAVNLQILAMVMGVVYFTVSDQDGGLGWVWLSGCLLQDHGFEFQV